MTTSQMNGQNTYQSLYNILSSFQRLEQNLPRPLSRVLSWLRRSIELVFANKSKKQRSARWSWRQIFSLSNALILLWLCTIWWGERRVFKTSLTSCQWDQWEKWPSEARPHHVVLVADPQLVDPHTYPGRPWPLSSLTVFYTDRYIRRAYAHMQQYLQPDTLFFLGDLFDGGREWATGHSSSPEERYKKYGNRYWMKEYNRFSRIFVDAWLNGGIESLAEPRGRKMIASLPGNHDLGFASGIQGPVKERFETYFGTGNRIDIIGNHTFISVDTVSLSAMDEVDPKTGSSGFGDGTSPSAANRDIWGSTEEFLSGARQAKNRAAKQELRLLAGLSEQSYHDAGLLGYAPNITDLADVRKTTEAIDVGFGNAEKAFPSILLTHVPLHRAPDTDCGGQRERGHAIHVQAGYQYQNVLTPLISKDIVTKLGVEDITQVYSGDDHDYCEIEHGEFTGRIKEITVKSISWAMGIRKPGFLAISLHNPVIMVPTANDEDGQSGARRDTIQNHLCLLPDQLAIFIRYAMLLVLTLVVLAIKAVVRPSTTKHDGYPLLPLTKEKGEAVDNTPFFPHAISSTSSSSSDQIISGRVISAHRISRSGSPKLGGYGNLPASSRSSSPSKTKLNAIPAPATGTHVFSTDPGGDWGMPRGRQHRVRSRSRGMAVEFGHSIGKVAIPVLVFYVWLLRRG